MQSWLYFVSALALVAAAAWLRGRRGRQPLGVVLVVAAALVTAAWGYNHGYDLRKLVGACLMPVGLVWLGLGVLAWRVSAAGVRRLALAAWILWLGLGLAGNVRLGHVMVGWLERGYDRVDPLAVEPFDAVLVLGGGVTRHRHGQVTVGRSGDRVLLAARMYHLGQARVLVTSGPVLVEGEPPTGSVPRLTARIWQELGVPADAIVLVEGPTATREELEAFSRLPVRRSWRRVGLVTSAWHLRRATGLARRFGLSLTPLPADLSDSLTPPRPTHLIPQGEGLGEVHTACWEFLGALVGR